jgi:predicted nucleic acid-binding protein
MIVVDASVAAKWYIDEPDCDAARSLIGATSDCIAPDLILAEFANVAWKRLSRHEISEEQATAMVDHLPSVLLEIVPCLALRQPALSIAIALDHPAYDGFYLALAMQRGLNLVTADKRLLDRVRGTPWEATVLHIRSTVTGS